MYLLFLLILWFRESSCFFIVISKTDTYAYHYCKMLVSQLIVCQFADITDTIIVTDIGIEPNFGGYIFLHLVKQSFSKDE